MSERSFDGELETNLIAIAKHEKIITNLLERLDIKQCNLYKYAIYMCRLNNDYDLKKYLRMYKEHNFGRYN